MHKSYGEDITNFFLNDFENINHFNNQFTNTFCNNFEFDRTGFDSLVDNGIGTNQISTNYFSKITKNGEDKIEL